MGLEFVFELCGQIGRCGLESDPDTQVIRHGRIVLIAPIPLLLEILKVLTLKVREVRLEIKVVELPQNLQPPLQLLQSIQQLVMVPVGQSVRHSVGQSVSRSVGQSVGRSDS